MKRMFDFLCEDFHEFEAFVDVEARDAVCPLCGKAAKRMVSAPNIKLEGITGSFPGAYDRWERVRAEKLKVEQKRNNA